MSMKNSNDTIGNRTRDLPACSAVPPRAPTTTCRGQFVTTVAMRGTSLAGKQGPVAIVSHPIRENPLTQQTYGFGKRKR